MCCLPDKLDIKQAVSWEACRYACILPARIAGNWVVFVMPVTIKY